MANPILPGIEHIVVLMFENRSFDNMLGGLYPQLSQSGKYLGLTGTETNPLYPGSSDLIQVWQGGVDVDTMIMPYPDPGELFTDMNQQIFASETETDTATMQGFVWNYMRQPPSPDYVYPVAENIMQYYAPGASGNIPITSLLAQAYAVSDFWHASGPVQTLANRIFAHCATPSKYKSKDGNWYAVLNNPDITSQHLDPDGSVTDTSIFELLDDGGQSWKVYFHDWPLSALVKYVDDNWGIGGNVLPFQSDLLHDFYEDVQKDTLPAYSFIEPRYTDYFWGTASSNHPGGSTVSGKPPAISVCNGEQLLQAVYTALYNGPNNMFGKTLLIVTYDEHGGLFDHIPPPAAASPFETGEVTGFDYTRYGVRVPALFIHPYIQRNQQGNDLGIFRPPQGTVFDHTSLISTLIAQFGLAGPLTMRDYTAPTLAGLIDPTQPVNSFSPSDLPDINTCPPPPVAQPASTAAATTPQEPPPHTLAAVIKQAVSAPKNRERVRAMLTPKI
ncbi:MAG TPA: alkaline phosphatase family protein [Pyrinomonadaceae bacterium]|nr:alkaline phosphatase family protein [Pyrinomonadaceae bacterium]